MNYFNFPKNPLSGWIRSVKKAAGLTAAGRYITGARQTLLAALALVAVTVTGCDVNQLNDTIDDFGVIIGLEPIHTNSTVLITDKKSGELINDEVTVAFDGPNGTDVIDMYSDPLPSESVKGGILNFGISNSITPSAGAPVMVTLHLEAEGYIPTSKTVAITEEGMSDFSFELVKKSDPPASVKSTSVQTTTNVDGSVAEDVEIESEVNADGESGATASIPSGTRFMDSEGNALRGELTTELTNFDPGDAESLESFPFDIELGADEAAEIGGISMIEVRDANGNVADSTVAPPTKNKQAGGGSFMFTYRLSSAYASPGDLLTFTTYTYQYVYTAWGYYRTYRTNYYNDIEVKDLGGGRVGVQVPVNSLPSAICVYRIVRAPRSATVTVNRNGHKGVIEGYASTYGQYRNFRIPAGQSSITLPRILNRGYNVYINQPVWKQGGYVNLYQQSSLTIDLPEPPSNEIDATVNVVLRCSNSSHKVRVTDIPGASVVYRKTNAAPGSRWKLGKNLKWTYDEASKSLTGGSMDIEGVEQGVEYTFKITYDGNAYTRNIMVDGSEVTYEEVIKDSVCS